MIVEQRIYTLVPGAVSRYLTLYEQRGLAVQRRHLGRLVGYYTSESGELNQLIHMWAYENHEDRARRRAALYVDPKWTEVVETLLAMIVRMDSRIFIPTSFFVPYLESCSLEGDGEIL